MKRTLVLAAASASLMASLAACGAQTDARVSDSGSLATASAASPSDSAVPTESAVPSDAASPSGDLQSSLAAATPYVTVDCVSGQAMPTDTPPSRGTTIGPVTGSLQPNGAPAITVATDATPADALHTADMVVGTGAEVKPGDTLTVDYCGVGLGGKTLFDSSYSRGTPASFPLDGVIAGWQQGMLGMKVGGTRLLAIPGSLAYGPTPPEGSGIQPDETLIFIVNLQSIS